LLPEEDEDDYDDRGYGSNSSSSHSSGGGSGDVGGSMLVGGSAALAATAAGRSGDSVALPPLPCGLVITHRPLKGADPVETDTHHLTVGRATCEDDLVRSVSVSNIAETLELPAESISHVVRHWIERRRLKKWRPLLRRFFKPSPREWMVAQAPTNKFRYEMSLSMRHKFEKLRMLVDLVRKREETKKQLAEHQQLAFYAALEARGVGTELLRPPGMAVAPFLPFAGDGDVGLGESGLDGLSAMAGGGMGSMGGSLFGGLGGGMDGLGRTRRGVGSWDGSFREAQRSDSRRAEAFGPVGRQFFVAAIRIRLGFG
jgi:hypothetical protein